MTEQTRTVGRPPGHVLSTESRAAISDGLRRAWEDPEKRARLNANKSAAAKKAWETRRRRAEEAAEAALLAEQGEVEVTPGAGENVPETGTETH